MAKCITGKAKKPGKCCVRQPRKKRKPITKKQRDSLAEGRAILCQKHQQIRKEMSSKDKNRVANFDVWAEKFRLRDIADRSKSLRARMRTYAGARF